MYLRRIVICATLVLLFTLLFYSQSISFADDTNREDKEVVQWINITGNSTFSDTTLKKFFRTKEKKFLFFFKKATFNRNVLEEDLDKLKKFYHSEGFYDIKIKEIHIKKIPPNQIYLTIEISEGQPVIIDSLKITINNDSKSPWLSEIYDIIPLKKGKRFRIEDYKKTKKVILRLFAEWGYPKAKITSKARIHKKKHKAYIYINILTGPLCYFGRIKIIGLKKVSESEVLKNITFKPGDRFQASKIKDSQKKLFNSQLFTFVDIMVSDNGSSNILPITIHLKEAKPYTIKSGFGFATEEKFRGRIELEARRFMGDGRRLKLYAKGSFIDQIIESEFIQPHFLNSRNWISWKIGLQHEDAESYETKTLYSTPRIYLYSDPVTWFYLGHNLEYNKLDSIEIVNYSDLTDRQKDNYFISSIVLGWQRDKVDDMLDPHNGYRIYLKSEWASQWTGSQTSYLKSSAEFRSYIPVLSGLTFGIRGKWGTIVNLEDDDSVPIFKRFFAGGSSSVRGYPYQKLGPLDEEGNPTGGESLLEGNLELRFPLKLFGHNLEGVVFFDFGQVYEKQVSLSLSKIRYTTGCGLRYKTPIGPLRLDIGYQLNPPGHDFFGPFQLHFSIGQAF